MPYVSGGLYDGRVTFRVGLGAPFVQFPEHCEGFAAGKEVGSLGTRANWRSWASFVNESLERFCATGGISVQQVGCVICTAIAQKQEVIKPRRLMTRLCMRQSTLSQNGGFPFPG